MLQVDRYTSKEVIVEEEIKKYNKEIFLKKSLKKT